MFSPSRKLIGLALVLSPVSLLPVIGTLGMFVALLIYSLLFLWIYLDLQKGRQQAYGVTLGLLPEVRQAKHQSGHFHVDISSTMSGHEIKMRIGIPFPPELVPETEEQDIILQGNGNALRTEWAFTPVKRGKYVVDNLFAQMQSPRGFWLFKKSLAADLTFKIFPDLRQDRKVMAGLFLSRGRMGAHLQKKTGNGREYDQVRDYQPGDSRMDIHWKSSAKRNSPVTRTYQIERTQDVYLVIDHSRLSARLHPVGEGFAPEPILERYVNTANLLAMAALRNGDLFGLMSFSDQNDQFLRAGNGPQHLKAVQNTLFNLEPRNVYPDYNEWVRFTRIQVRRRSLMIVLTDLSDATAFESLEKQISLLSRSHLVVVAMIPLPGVSPLFSGDAENQDPYMRLAGHLMWRDLHSYQKRLHRLRVPLLLCPSENLALDVINHYLLIKQQQRL